MNGAPSEGLCISEQRPSTCRMVQPAARKRRSHGPSRRAKHRGESRDQTPEAKIRYRFDEEAVTGARRSVRAHFDSEPTIWVASLSCCNFAAAQVPGSDQSM